MPIPVGDSAAEEIPIMRDKYKKRRGDQAQEIFCQDTKEGIWCIYKKKGGEEDGKKRLNLIREAPVDIENR